MGAAFKLTDAIDESIISKLKTIGQEAETTAGSYAKLVVEMGKMQGINPKGIADLEAKAAKYNETVKLLHETQSKLNELQKQQKDIYAQVSKQIQEQVKQEREKAKLEGQILANENKRIKNQQLLERQNRKTAVSQEEITRALNTEAKTMAEVAEQNRVLRKAMQGVDFTTEEGLKTLETYNKKLAENDALLDKHSDAMTQRKRNIGNYASAWNGLGMSVQQLARELPSLSMGFNTFFLAISNNLPMLADEIKRARMEFQAMKAAGEKATPVWKQLAGAIFNWQTALVVGITALSMYGKEIMAWVGNLFKGKDAADSYSKAVEGVNESLQDNLGGYGETITKLKALRDEWNNLGDNLKSKKEFIKENGDLFEALGISVDDVNSAEKVFVNSTPTLIEVLGMKAKATAAYNLSVEEEAKAMKKRMEAEKAMTTTNIWDYWNAGVDVITHLDAVIQGIDMWNPEQYAKARGGGLLLEADAADKAANSYRNLYNEWKKQADELLKNAGFDLTTKGKKKKEKELDIEKELADSKIALIEDERKRELAENKRAFTEKLAQIKGNSEKELELRENLTELQKRKEAEINKKYDEKDAQKELSDLEKEYAGKSVVATSKYQEELDKLAELYAQGNKTKEKYEKEKVNITRRYGIEEANLSIELMEKQVAVSNLSEETKNSLMEKLAKARIKLAEMERDAIVSTKEEQDEALKKQIQLMKDAFDEMESLADSMVPGLGTVFDAINDIFEKIVAKEKVTVEDILMSVSAVAQGLSQLMTGIYQNQIDKLEEEEEALQESHDKEIESIENLAERGAISEEEAEARKRAAEDKTAKKEEEIAKKKAALQTKQAKLEKAANIVTTIMNTAVGIMKAFAQGGMFAGPMAAMIGAMGAIQLATIIAQPIPKYAKGTKSHKGGLAVVGDGGVSETVITDKGMYVTPDTPTLVDLPKGAQVIPFVIDMDMMKAKASDVDGLMAYRKENELPPVTIENDYSGLERKLERLEKSQKQGFATLARAIKNQDYKRFAASI